MKSVNIDLGEEYENSASPCCAPSPSEGKRYPTFYYDCDEELSLPKEGKMTIEFKRVSETKSESDPGGKRYSVTIQVQKIVAIDGDVVAPTAKYDSAGDALDSILKALQKEKE
jgi:hypothetical protein